MHDGLRCVNNSRACLPNDLITLDDPGEESSDADDEEGVSDHGESSDEEAANTY